MLPPNPERIVRTLEEILQWCSARRRLQIPGEGLERAFRGRLHEAFLEKVIGWPPETILAGERFDISLLDTEQQPVVTIETKEPGHVTTDAEYRAFLRRLRRYGSLRHAFITNGTLWERFDLSRQPADDEEITLSSFDEESQPRAGALFGGISKIEAIGKHWELRPLTASLEKITDFFSPLLASHYYDLSRPLPPGLHRHRLTREKPHVIEDFGGVLRDRIEEFRELLNELFGHCRSGTVGKEAAEVSRSSFAIWCERSYVVPPHEVARRIEQQLQGDDVSSAELASLLSRDIGFLAEPSAAVAETIYAESRKKNSSAERRRDLLWPLYETAVETYATQTAHVCVARLLLYRIGEDQGFFESRVSGEPLRSVLSPPEESDRLEIRRQPRVLTVIESLRSDMAEFAPSVYESGEFDWWRVVHPEFLTPDQRQRVSEWEGRLAVAYQRLLRRLNIYDLSAIDLDIWRDIYQHYLPEEERQRLGGFYTPQELVDLTLDHAKYLSSVPALCKKSIIDLASGSGAFVVSAMQRLLDHLNDPNLPCHRDLHSRNLADWERAEAMLKLVVRNIHAIDLHPFAAFLTFINYLFVVLPLLAKVQKKRPMLGQSVSIFSANALLTPGENGPQRELELAINSRIQLGRHAQQRYRELAGKKFDFVVGNPPWGGILKGRLAPIFDDSYKRQLEAQYPDTYSGKLDIYGLFYDRALQWLRPGATVGLVTQGSFIDKEWAGPGLRFLRGERLEIMGLRRKLAEQATLRFLIDLNPFGQLFFGAMNIPCVAIFEKRPPGDKQRAVVLLSSKKSWERGLSLAEKRNEVVRIVRQCISLVEKSSEPLKQDFASAFTFPLERLRSFRGSRWLLSPKPFSIRIATDWPSVAELLEPSQGLTVGGEGALDIFLMTETAAKQLRLEGLLLHRIIKGLETKAWRVHWGGNVILYPYIKNKKGKWQPAFTCNRPPVLDALDFEHPADKFEQDWLRKYGSNPVSFKRLLEHRRDALELYAAPVAAEYLLKFYQELSGRDFEKRNIVDLGKQWYEFHRPRDPDVILGHPKIISPRLTPRVRFALDLEGIAIQDSCICLAIGPNTRAAFEDFMERLRKLAGHEVKLLAVLRYILAFLNSSYAQDLLVTGRRPTPKGHYQIDDQFLGELRVPIGRTKKQLRRVLDGVDSCLAARTEKAVSIAEAKLNAIVGDLYG